MQVVDAAAHLEEVERVVGELFCSGAGGERSIVKRSSAQAAETDGDRGARVFVFQMQLNQRSEAQTEAVGVSLRKNGTKQLVEKKSGFEVGASGTEFDPANMLAEI